MTLLEALPGERWERKLRLAACALWWRYSRLLKDEERETVRTAERFAEGLVAPEELAPHRARGLGVAAGSGRTAFSEVYRSISNKARLWPMYLRDSLSDDQRERARQELARTAIAVLRDVVGNPFRLPAVPVAWLAGNDRAVVRLAQGICEERTFERLPILGDALEEAGCTCADILDHCRHGRGHTLGCWVLDLVLGKA